MAKGEDVSYRDIDPGDPPEGYFGYDQCDECQEGHRVIETKEHGWLCGRCWDTLVGEAL